MQRDLWDREGEDGQPLGGDGDSSEDAWRRFPWAAATMNRENIGEKIKARYKESKALPLPSPLSAVASP